MEVLYRRCCGLDVHKETVVACLRVVSDGKVDIEVRTFATTTASLIALSEWLAQNGCTHIAMEATGIYWKPVWHILADGEFQLVLANSAHVKNVPGRKSDVNDATWVAELLAHGLIRASFVPNTQTQELRTLMRTRKQLVREKASHILRVQKTLEDANIKLDSVITDIMGMSARAMIEALMAGESDPTKVASLANYRLKASQQNLREALRGRVTTHHRFLLRLHLNQIDALDVAVAMIDRQVEAGIAPFRVAVEQVSTIPGIREIGAQVIISEIGTDMSRFPSDGHLISWAGLCPRSDESAGKRRSNRLRKGAQQPSLCLRLRAPYLYPDRVYSAIVAAMLTRSRAPAAKGHDQTSAQQCPPGAAKRFSKPRDSEWKLATGIVGPQIGGRTTSCERAIHLPAESERGHIS